MSRKVDEIRSHSIPELQKMRSDLKEKLMRIRFKAKIEPPTNIMEKRELKRQIARINTIITEKEKEAEQTKFKR